MNKKLAEKLHKPVIRKYRKRKLNSPFVDNIWGAQLANMQLFSKFKEFAFYDVLLIFPVNMHQLFLWKIKKLLQILMLFKIVLKNLIANQTK